MTFYGSPRKLIHQPLDQLLRISGWPGLSLLPNILSRGHRRTIIDSIIRTIPNVGGTFPKEIRDVDDTDADEDGNVTQ